MGYITFKDAINSAYYSAKENTRSIWSQINCYSRNNNCYGDYFRIMGDY
ncbi:MAG: hypothetical protein ACTSPQ_16790 [Candidatus Helarchaeota archaeon]